VTMMPTTQLVFMEGVSLVMRLCSNARSQLVALEVEILE
jgi:hypothetical protein